MLPASTRGQIAVFGFCDIRRFTDTTEVLQEGVMEFVNTIAHLVHGAVAARGGAANKNIGDAFLLVGGGTAVVGHHGCTAAGHLLFLAMCSMHKQCTTSAVSNLQMCRSACNHALLLLLTFMCSNWQLALPPGVEAAQGP
jgi:class 3 adenylate cyclase